MDPDGNYFFRLFGSTSAQRQSARLYQKVFGGKIENLMKESIHVQKQMGGEVSYEGGWYWQPQASGELEYVYMPWIGCEVALQVTYFDYNTGSPVPYYQNPSS